MLIDTLKTLCALPGVSGGEDAVRDYLRELAAPHADSIRVDAIGNLIIEKKGRIPGSKKLMLAAHMDEVGLMIRAITDDGYLKFDTVGGIDRRVLIGKPVLVGPKKVPGVIGLKAYHLTSREEEKTVPKLKDFYIDIGAEDKETAEDLVYRGDLVVFDTDILEFGHGFLKAKAIDDRIGCAVMAELLQEPLPMDCTFVFTVQEEVGTRGAFGAAFSVTPDIALVLEGTTAADLPDMPPHKRVCALVKDRLCPTWTVGRSTTGNFLSCYVPWPSRGEFPGKPKSISPAARMPLPSSGARPVCAWPALRPPCATCTHPPAWRP